MYNLNYRVTIVDAESTPHVDHLTFRTYAEACDYIIRTASDYGIPKGCVEAGYVVATRGVGRSKVFLKLQVDKYGDNDWLPCPSSMQMVIEGTQEFIDDSASMFSDSFYEESPHTDPMKAVDFRLVTQ